MCIKWPFLLLSSGTCAFHVHAHYLFIWLLMQLFSGRRGGGGASSLVFFFYTYSFLSSFFYDPSNGSLFFFHGDDNFGDGILEGGRMQVVQRLLCQ
jgi:hypothetical protein